MALFRVAANIKYFPTPYFSSEGIKASTLDFSFKAGKRSARARRIAGGQALETHAMIEKFQELGLHVLLDHLLQSPNRQVTAFQLLVTSLPRLPVASGWQAARIRAFIRRRL